MNPKLLEMLDCIQDADDPQVKMTGLFVLTLLDKLIKADEGEHSNLVFDIRAVLT
jgi:hypothetical protein